MSVGVFALNKVMRPPSVGTVKRLQFLARRLFDYIYRATLGSHGVALEATDQMVMVTVSV